MIEGFVIFDVISDTLNALLSIAFILQGCCNSNVMINRNALNLKELLEIKYLT